MPATLSGTGLPPLIELSGQSGACYIGHFKHSAFVATRRFGNGFLVFEDIPADLALDLALIIEECLCTSSVIFALYQAWSSVSVVTSK